MTAATFPGQVGFRLAGGKNAERLACFIFTPLLKQHPEAISRTEIRNLAKLADQPRQESACSAVTLAPGRSNFYAGGHSFRSNATITTPWKASPLPADSRRSPSCTAAVEG
jgi:hypothetical protein